MNLEEILIDWNEFKIRLESFTTILPYKKIIDTEHLVRYAFIFDKEPYVVDFDYRYASKEKFAVLTFYAVGEDNTREYGQTNKNKYAGPCFGTVLDIVKQEQSKWNGVCFTGAESKVGIYNQLFKKNALGMFKYNYVLPDNSILYIVSKIEIPIDDLKIVKEIAIEIMNSKLN